MRTKLLVWSIVVCLAPALQAQQWPGYSPYGMPAQGFPTPPMPMNPYGHGNNTYPQGYVQPAAPTQGGAPRVYYGEFPNAVQQPAQAPVSPPQPRYIPTQSSTGAGNANGGTMYYYYPSSPYSPTPYNYYPYGQLGRSMPAPLPSKAVGWPNPTPRHAKPDAANDEPRAEMQRLAALPFHRQPKDTFWISAEYMALLARPMRVSGPLLSTGSATDSAPGALGQIATTVLFPTQDIDFGLFSGVRVNSGLFLDDADRISLELQGFYQSPNTSTHAAAGDSTGNPVLARPVFNVTANREGAFVNTLPGTIQGSINFDFKSQMFGAELNARMHSYWWQRFHSDFLVGFRYVGLQESMRVTESIQPLTANFLTFQGGVVNAPNSLFDDDSFRTTNNFFGPQIGTRLSWEYGYANFDFFAKLALGGSVQRTTIEGATTLVTPNGNTVAPGGIIALPSNNGTYTRTILGIVPEFGVNVGVDVTQQVRVQLGYSFLLWNQVARPGGAFDRNVNPSQVPGSPTFGAPGGGTSPVFRFNDELFWAHSFNIGLHFHY